MLSKNLKTLSLLFGLAFAAPAWSTPAVAVCDSASGNCASVSTNNTLTTGFGLGTSTLLNAVTGTGAGTAYTNANGCTSYSMQYTTTGSPTSTSVRLEGSNDNSTWVQISAAGTTNSGGIVGAAGPWSFVRANLTTLSGGASPTLTAKMACSVGAGSQLDFQGRTVSMVQGIDGNNASVASNPFVAAGYSWTDGTNPTATTAGNVTKLLTTTDGRLVVSQDHPKRFSCFVAASTATGLTAFGSPCAAPGAGLSLYITDINFSRSAAAGTAADSFPTIKSGTGGTCGTATAVIWAALNLANQPVIQQFTTPIKVTVNSEICWIDSTAGTTTAVVNGYIAP